MQHYNINRVKLGNRAIRRCIPYFRRYLENCNLHGCRYVVDKKYNTRISICWLILCITSFAFCIYLIFLQLTRFQETAVLNSIASTGYPVWKDPFPFVAICNSNVVYKNRTTQILQALASRNVSEDDALEFLSNLSYLIPRMDDDVKIDFDMQKQLKIEEIANSIGYNTDKIMREVAHPCQSMLKKCVWMSEERSCRTLFKTIKTTLGYCCAFNYYAIKMYQDSYNKAFFNGGFGINSGLQIVIDVEPDQYIASLSTNPSVYVLVKHALEFADFGTDSYLLQLGHNMIVSVGTNVFKGDKDLKYLKDVTRSCWFYNEGELKWTKYYNHLTCFNECEANYIFKICGCVPFYYPVSGHKRVCAIKDIPCLIRNKSIFNSLMLTDNNATPAQYASDNRFCYCLANCDAVGYSLHRDRRHDTKFMNTTTCGLYVFFSNVAGILRLRTVHVTWDTLLAIIGGLFGLCLGGSVITIFEMLFFVLQAIFQKPGKNMKKNVINTSQTVFIP